MIKKLNVASAWLALAVIITHTVIMTVSLFSGWYNFAVCKGFSYASGGLMTLHALTCLILYFFMPHECTPPEDNYEKTQLRLQRISGILLMLLIHTHVKAFGFISLGTPLSVWEKCIMLTAEFAWLLSLLLHIGASVSRWLPHAFKGEKAKAVCRRCSWIISAVITVAAYVSMVYYTVNWTGW